MLSVYRAIIIELIKLSFRRLKLNIIYLLEVLRCDITIGIKFRYGKDSVHIFLEHNRLILIMCRNGLATKNRFRCKRCLYYENFFTHSLKCVSCFVQENELYLPILSFAKVSTSRENAAMCKGP